MTPEEVATLQRCIAVGGVAVFPADTVYGLATEPDSKEGVHRLYVLKGRPPARPAAVMFFSLELALTALPELAARTRAAVERLLPGGLTLLLPNPAHRYPLACGPSPEVLGLRVPLLEGELAPLTALKWPVLQSSANRSGDARRAPGGGDRPAHPRRRRPDPGRRRAPGHVLNGCRPDLLRGERGVRAGARGSGAAGPGGGGAGLTVEEVLAWLEERRASPADLAGMARFGIRTDDAYGVKLPELRRLARSLGHDHRLAAGLWATGQREPRLLAAMVEETERVTPAQMDRWAGQLDSWDVCDGVCLDLFRHTPHAWAKAREWSAGARHGFTRRAGLVLIALLARSDDARDDDLLPAIALAAAAAHDGRNEVIKGASWALRNIGRRDARLAAAVEEAATELTAAAERGPRWVGRDVLSYLRRQSPSV